MGGLAARRQRKVRITLIVLVVVALAAASVLWLAQRPWEADASGAKVTTVAEPPPVTPAPNVVAVPDNGPIPSGAAIGAALGPGLANPDLGQFTGSVSDALTGTVLWSAAEERPMTPASTTKLLTAAAAMLALPMGHRVPTTVVAGQSPNELVLVGGGDVTLTAQPVGEPSFYPGSPRIDDLVEQIQRSGVKADTIIVDTGAFTGPGLAQGWSPGDIAGGYIAPIEPVMLDGGRLNPLQDESPRTATPALDVGRVLASRLGIDPANVRIGNAQSGAAPIAGVQSAPLRDRLGQMIGRSDNVLAEAIGREVAIKANADPSFAGAVSAVSDALRANDFDLAGVLLHDLSGLSVDNRVPARVLDSILLAAAGETQPALRPMLDYLPVAGGTGTLEDRYADGDRAGAGWVRAKTGTLADTSALAGYVVDVSGRVLTFAFMSHGRPPEASRPALDALAATLRSCGCV
ncbi:D-alanyl-D-alanine carboxypeptidase/D-alanyl-D-alanine-endopeptidase [Antrihabitans sp. YC2-6]|nr:D-alanyl-D-alanine carboxypeptidase/D-alanyl-D-alanine-endopeptidase [Antrihabitans sp. YC2-6]